jgi:hypothetical protein
MSAVKGDASGKDCVAVAGVATGENSAGLFGKADTNGIRAEGGANGVYAQGKDWCGVVGISSSKSGGSGVYGENTGGGTGIVGKSTGWHAIAGFSESPSGGFGLYGEALGTGVGGVSKNWMGVYGETKSTTGGAGVCGKGKIAGLFEGDVIVTGDIQLTNADCAEHFDVSAGAVADPGTVMSIGEDGGLLPCERPYDCRVAGVTSGAGEYRPAIVLDRQGEDDNRRPIALVGKVYCKVDAQYGPIAIGDLLTTSSTLGHAMRAADPSRAFGTVIGKALRPWSDGRGLIPILVALQ